MKTLLITAVRFYRNWISPALPGSCRFAPTCSEYSLQAFEKYGAWKGTWLTIERLFRCHPFHPGGYDPVPGKSGVGVSGCGCIGDRTGSVRQN